MPYRAVVLHGIGQAAGIIVVVAVGSAVHGLAGSQSAGIIGEAQAGTGFRSCCQTSAVRPAHRPASAIEVAGGVANGIVSKITPQRLLRIFVCLHNIHESLICPSS